MADVNPGTKLTNLFPPTKYFADATPYAVTSDTFTTGGQPVVGGTFLTNSLGKILVSIGGWGHGATDTNIYLAYEIYEGSDQTGTLVVAANAATRGAGTTTQTRDHSINRGPIRHVLTANATHYIRVQHRREGTSSSGGIERREICVAPTF
jgi:hypothetical protein